MSFSGFPWTRYLSWARVLLAAVALAIAGFTSHGVTPAVALPGACSWWPASWWESAAGTARPAGNAGAVRRHGLLPDRGLFRRRPHAVAGGRLLPLPADGSAGLLGAGGGGRDHRRCRRSSALFFPVPEIHVLEPMVVVAGVLAYGFAVYQAAAERALTEAA